MDKIIPIVSNGLCSNCYLIKNNNKYILIDTGIKSKRKSILRSITAAGCSQEDLELIILTHGDLDHTGNALFFKNLYNCPIAMHRDDSEITQSGNMFINKKVKNKLSELLTKILLRLETFEADIFLENNTDLVDYGFDAKIIHLPVHSKGSIGILFNENLICGDLFENRNKPKLYFIDDKKQVEPTLKMLKSYKIDSIYPGHGSSFKLNDNLNLLNV